MGLVILQPTEKGLRVLARDQRIGWGVDPVERPGQQKAERRAAGEQGQGPRFDNLVEVGSRSDHPDHVPKGEGSFTLSPVSGEGMDALVDFLIGKAKDILPDIDQVSINARQADHLAAACENLGVMMDETDYLIVAEHLRMARKALDAITGRASTEDMLDGLFGKFCIGK